jgi:hypothetical protein
MLAIGDRHAGGLLAAVLLREETEIDEPGDIFARRPDAEEAALLFRTLRPHAARC